MIGSEGPDADFLRDFREARLAIEPTASGFAALNASAENLNAMECCLEQYESSSIRVHGTCAVAGTRISTARWVAASAILF